MVIATKRKITKIFLIFLVCVIALNIFYYDYQICRKAQSSSNSIFCLVISRYVKVRSQGFGNALNVTGIVDNIRKPVKDYLKTQHLDLILKKEILNGSLESPKVSTLSPTMGAKTITKDTRQAEKLTPKNEARTEKEVETYLKNTSPVMTTTSTTTTTSPTTTTTTTPPTTTTTPLTTTTTSRTTTTTPPTTTNTQPTTTTTQPTTTTTPPTTTTILATTLSTEQLTTPTINNTLKCRIPKLDPFHREVIPYVRWNWINDTCKINQEKSRVEKGKLIVNLENVVEVSLNYIIRVDDYANKLEKHLIYNKNVSEDIKELSYKLENDFIKIDIREANKKPISEYHMYPIKKPNPEGPEFRKYDPGKSQFNIMMIMLDSVSHACAQRYIPKTYKFLQNNPYTTIMEGHTIVGDATTPQLCATFFGDQPENLKPEGRRGFRAAETIDKWPSLFKDLVKDGYATMHSEDEPFINSFNFRLHGFKKQPTLKYLRPWWRESNDLRKIKYWRSNSCPINFAMDYTKNFYKEYAEELSAVFLMNSALTHNEPERVQMLDNGFIKFFQYLNESKRLESTAVIFFGDHGMREGGFRSTIQGKLEERLPFMTITLPPIFYQRHPELVKNLQRNSKALTTPYDIHATLKHLIQFTSGEIPKHKFGRSLFTNIVSLNRECGEAGVTPFWCVCRNFAPVKNLNDPTVREIATAITNSINEVVFKNEIAKPQCQTLSLDQIHRASKMIRAAKDDGAFQSYELVLKLKPCGGLFEATAEYDMKNKKVNVGKNFSRINLYGDQPKCIQQQFPYLRKFCCCNGQF